MDAFEQLRQNVGGKQQSGTPNLRSLNILQQLSTEPSSVSMTDVIGLIGGGALGLYVATKFPNAIVKYVGVIAGAEIGIMIARTLRHE